MSVTASRERVSAVLSALERAYGSVPVSQTTVSVPPVQYEEFGAVADRTVLDVRVHVRDDDRSLVVTEGGRTDAPVGPVRSTDRIERAARDVVRRTTGVECRLTDLEHVVIVGVSDAADSDRETRYRLTAVFDADYVDGDPAGDAEWRTERPDLAAF